MSKIKWEEALGWMHAEACVSLDKGKDIRKAEIPELLEKAKKDLERPAPELPTDYKTELLNLLAIIHRDGGHYANDFGIEEAVKEAKILSSNRIALAEQPAPEPQNPTPLHPTPLHELGIDPNLEPDQQPQTAESMTFKEWDISKQHCHCEDCRIHRKEAFKAGQQNCNCQSQEHYNEGFSAHYNRALKSGAAASAQRYKKLVEAADKYINARKYDGGWYDDFKNLKVALEELEEER